MSSAICTAAIIPCIVDNEGLLQQVSRKDLPFPLPRAPHGVLPNLPQGPPLTPGGSVSNGMNRQCFQAISRLLRSRFPKPSPGEPVSVRPPRLFAA